MQSLNRLLLASLLFLAPEKGFSVELGQETQARNSLCRPEEQVFFSCRVANGTKFISICGSKHLDNRRGYLQYRFGKPGAVELQFPRERANTQLAFRYAHYFRPQGDRTEITFDNGNYQYVVFDYLEGDIMPATTVAGVRISKYSSSGSETELQCQGKATSRLGGLATIVRRDPDNALNQ